MPDKDKISELLVDRRGLADDKLIPRLMKGGSYGYEIKANNLPKLVAKITQLLLEERIDEIRNFAGYEDDDWNGIAQIPQQRFIERIATLEAALKEVK